MIDNMAPRICLAGRELQRAVGKAPIRVLASTVFGSEN